MRCRSIPVGLCCALLLLLLTGCGGGGGGSSSDASSDDTITPSATIAEGRFIDSPVSGLTFICGDMTGTTDTDGTFTYYVGESITFMIGDVVLGLAIGADVITPVDLVEDAEDVNNPTVINLLRFIQTLDDDGNPENGIVISDEMRSLVIDVDIDFKQTISAFETDASLATLLESLPQYADGSVRILITVEGALAHFQDNTNWSDPSNTAYHFNDAEVIGDLATGDFNGDGIADLVFTIRTLQGYSLGTNLQMFRIVYGDGAGGISETVDLFRYGDGSSGKTRNNIVVGDYNADGIDDFAFSGDVLQIFSGSNNGAPQEFYIASEFFGPCLYDIDIDNNGAEDFFTIVMDDYGRMFSMVHNNGDGTFGDKEYLGYFYNSGWSDLGGGTPLNALIGDFNGDGTPDIVTLFAGTNRYSDITFEHIALALWKGNGDGTIDYPISYNLLSDDLFIGSLYFDENYKKMVAGDFDQDGDLDIVITSTTNFLRVLLNDGTGNFSDNGRVEVGQAPSNVCTGDFNQDGILDIASINQDSKELVISFGNGDGTFVEKDSAISIDLDSDVELFDLVVFDFNNDGVPDIALAEDGTNPSDTGRGSIQVFLSPGLVE